MKTPEQFLEELDLIYYEDSGREYLNKSNLPGLLKAWGSYVDLQFYLKNK